MYIKKEIEKKLSSSESILINNFYFLLYTYSCLPFELFDLYALKLRKSLEQLPLVFLYIYRIAINISVLVNK